MNTRVIITIMNSAALLNMLQICDSLFPIGTFTLSNGLETFVQKGRLTNPAEMESYVRSYLSVLPYNELGVMALAYGKNDMDYIAELDNLWGASRAPSEIRNGSEKTCARFFKVWEKIRSYKTLEAYKALAADKSCYGHHPIAVGLFAAETHIPFEEAAQIYTYSLLSAITTNTVKTIPLSQLDGQRVLNNSFALIPEAISIAKQITLDDIGVSGTEFEIFAMNHEILHSRLYMS